MDRLITKRRIKKNGIEIVLFEKTIIDDIIPETIPESTQSVIDVNQVIEQKLAEIPSYDDSWIKEYKNKTESTFSNLKKNQIIKTLYASEIQLPFAVRNSPRDTWGGPGKAGIFWQDPGEDLIDTYSIKMGGDNVEIEESGYTFGYVNDLAMKFTMGAEEGRGFVWDRIGPAAYNHKPVMSLDAKYGNLVVRGDIITSGSLRSDNKIYSGGVDIATLWGGGGSSTYTNATPMPETVGGLEAGTTFTNQTMTQMFDALLYPYQEPTFSSFSIAGQSTSLEVGDSAATGTITFSWATTNSSNVETNSIDIYSSSPATQIFDGIANDGSESYDNGGGNTRDDDVTTNWTISGTNTNEAGFSRVFTVRWYWRVYWGSSSDTSATESMIEGLQNSALRSTEVATYTCDENNYKWMCWPTKFGEASSFYYAGFPVAMEDPETVSVTNSFGITTDYYAYRTTNPSASEMDIVVT